MMMNTKNYGASTHTEIFELGIFFDQVIAAALESVYFGVCYESKTSKVLKLKVKTAHLHQQCVHFGAKVGQDR